MEYHINLDLPNDLRLTILLYSHEEQRFVYEHELPNLFPKTQSKTWCKYRFNVYYEKGDLKELEISMEIINRDKRGKEYYLGVDISPGSKLFVQFFYNPEGDKLEMKYIELDSQKYSIPKQGINLPVMQGKQLPFPLEVELNYGEWMFEYQNRNTGNEKLRIKQSIKSQ